MRTAAGAPRQAGIPARAGLYHGQHRAGTMSPVFRIVWAVLMPVWIVSASPASGGPPPNIIVLLADFLGTVAVAEDEFTEARGTLTA